MSVHLASNLLLSCAVLNYIVLLGWFSACVFARGRMFTLHTRWFRLSEEGFDSIHYGCMAVYKERIHQLAQEPKYKKMAELAELRGG